jgi:ubiquinone/menaquinone biosynthesis C-methylase UbiE
MGRKRRSGSWDPVADWYAGWVGPRGSRHHVEVAIPELMGLLKPEPGETILDVGCGTGALCRPVIEAGSRYTGVDLSGRLIRYARKVQPRKARFVRADATRLRGVEGLEPRSFDAVTFLLSIQDIEPLAEVLASAAWALKPEGRVVMLMTHPCFRVPRQSGWSWDASRKLSFRRVDRYLTPLAVPMKSHGRGRNRGKTRSYHRPLQDYVDALASLEFSVKRLTEIPGLESGPPGRGKAGEGGDPNRDIPLFLALEAFRSGHGA